VIDNVMTYSVQKEKLPNSTLKHPVSFPSTPAHCTLAALAPGCALLNFSISLVTCARGSGLLGYVLRVAQIVDKLD
jgi:hypothetical protein